MAPMDAAPPVPRSPPTAADLLGMGRTELERRFAGAGLKKVHAETVWADVHRRLAREVEDLEQTPGRVRAHLRATGCTVGTPVVAAAVASADGFTRKFLLRFGDGVAVETVLMHYAGRATACVSTQAGCAMGCVFCATGQAGFTRNLTAGEIVAQVAHVARVLRDGGQRLRNVVLMGQGEPLHNGDAVRTAVGILTDQKGLALASHRVTLSTVGLVPGIRRLTEERWPVSLAVSLHGATDEERARLVPSAHRWPLAELMDACRAYTTTTGRRIFVEWALISGVNDTPTRAEQLARLLAGQSAQVNLIPLNPTGGYAGAPAVLPAARVFQEVLRAHGVRSTVRRRRGLDIAAGCGQLAGAGRADRPQSKS
jgi:23S rRNA (adenine2503-C2)-methyltransferase